MEETEVDAVADDKPGTWRVVLTKGSQKAFEEAATSLNMGWGSRYQGDVALEGISSYQSAAQRARAINRALARKSPTAPAE
jgi:hypothetical protein